MDVTADFPPAAVVVVLVVVVVLEEDALLRGCNTLLGVALEEEEAAADGAVSIVIGCANSASSSLEGLSPPIMSIGTRAREVAAAAPEGTVTVAFAELVVVVAVVRTLPRGAMGPTPALRGLASTFFEVDETVATGFMFLVGDASLDMIFACA